MFCILSTCQLAKSKNNKKKSGGGVYESDVDISCIFNEIKGRVVQKQAVVEF